jgi:hypothetical protein
LAWRRVVEENGWIFHMVNNNDRRID